MSKERPVLNAIAGASAPIIGSLIGAAVSKTVDVSRKAIAASMRETADALERGDLVSDEAFESLKSETSRVRDLINRAPT